MTPSAFHREGPVVVNLPPAALHLAGVETDEGRRQLSTMAHFHHHGRVRRGLGDSGAKKKSLRTSKYVPKTFAQHSYTDRSNEVPSPHVDEAKKTSCQGYGRGGVNAVFPLRLFRALIQMDDDGHADVASFQPHGRSFGVHRQKDFEALMPKYFGKMKFSSFQRQLNLYGFKRLSYGPDKGGYYHEYFLRGREYLTQNIHRLRVKGTGSRAACNPDQEPNFYKMTPIVGSFDMGALVPSRATGEQPKADALQRSPPQLHQERSSRQPEKQSPQQQQHQRRMQLPPALPTAPTVTVAGGGGLLPFPPLPHLSRAPSTSLTSMAVRPSASALPQKQLLSQPSPSSPSKLDDANRRFWFQIEGLLQTGSFGRDDPVCNSKHTKKEDQGKMQDETDHIDKGSVSEDDLLEICSASPSLITSEAMSSSASDFDLRQSTLPVSAITQDNKEGTRVEANVTETKVVFEPEPIAASSREGDSGICTAALSIPLLPEDIEPADPSRAPVCDDVADFLRHLFDDTNLNGNRNAASVVSAQASQEVNKKGRFVPDQVGSITSASTTTIHNHCSNRAPQIAEALATQKKKLGSIVGGGRGGWDARQEQAALARSRGSFSRRSLYRNAAA
eukprot:CAMPEP_0197446912 /NCGR_PEP_ID=MMETSP1175-20131217/11719_1 /TAXON_ID=1003142 /ORGANISM="Triceratium dubium, Strain CCMP147" /LENGTH=616 /DNA_ID=CAMNT_0042978085 /DNA_START=5 /DNA_END=1855 /DNA_ORIENTATION=-